MHYVATCRGCAELPESPRKATIHAMSTGHSLTETKHYLVAPAEEE